MQLIKNMLVNGLLLVVSTNLFPREELGSDSEKQLPMHRSRELLKLAWSGRLISSAIEFLMLDPVFMDRGLFIQRQTLFGRLDIIRCSFIDTGNGKMPAKTGNLCRAIADTFYFWPSLVFLIFSRGLAFLSLDGLCLDRTSAV